MKKRIIATILSIALMITQVPWTALDVFAATVNLPADNVGANTYISDSNTINGWKNYFTDSSTEYAGAVWTDKAVFTNSGNAAGTVIPSDFTGLAKKYVQVTANPGGTDEITMTTNGTADISVQNENFLVALSALGSTKEITGYSALPSDTVFILDVSNSMNTTAKQQMVEATNKAIEKLYGVNNHNRVGIVVYGYGSSVLLPIDRYTTTETATDSSGNTYKVYIELANYGGQIRSAREEVTTSLTTSPINITDSEYEDIAQALSNYGYNNMNSDQRRRARAEYLETNLPASKTGGVDIDWYYYLTQKQGGGNWENWLKNVVQTATTKTETVYLKDSAGEDVVQSVTANGATYVQAGLYGALELFKEKDTTIETGLIQGGTARLPIAVLMSDGAATYASPDYTEPTTENRDFGDGTSNSISDNLVFPTQLTAAYVSQQMEKHYGREALIYTLGLLDPDTTKQEAYRTLNPSKYTSTTINDYWKDYEATSQNANMNTYGEITRKESNPDSLTNYKNYVDQYFDATSADQLVAAFDDIVEAIILQSKYYPTLVESTNYDLDGYVSFEDELGEFMEVKDIKGIVLGDEIYTGEAFLYALNNSDAFGNAATWTAYGEELLRSISERLGIDDATARTLLAAAWRAGGTDANGNHNNKGQLHTENYIGWYADETGKYLGHWDDELHTAANYPSAAKYLNKCYIFQGDLSDSGTTSVSGGDMMHIVVQVHEEIATGHQCVRWFIPANLVPLVTYEITVDSNSLETAENIGLAMETSDPIRLLYEVGVDSEINDINMKDIVGSAHHNHTVVDSGNNVIGYAFYSNRWGEGHTLDGSGTTDKLDPTDHLATVSHFNPSKENERYYYVEDSLIYQESGGVYTLYKGDTAPSGNNFYRAYSVISKTGGNTGIEKEYVQISSAVLAETSDTLKIKRIDDADSANNGAWYVPAGQIYQQLTRERLLKNDGRSTGADKNGTDPEAGGNRTGTLDYYDYPVVERKGSGTQYSIYTFLGNNGRLVKYLTHGLKLTKTIDDASIAAGTEEFTFTVEFSNASGVKLSDANGNDITADATTSGKFVVSGNTVTVKIKNGETVYFTGIAAGTEYTVKEIYDKESGYVVKSATSSETADGYGVSGTGKNTVVKGKIDQYVIDTAEFINTETSHAGNLVVSKTITHPYGDNYTIPVNSNTVFKVDVVFDVNDFVWATDETTKTFNATGTVKYKISETEYATGIIKAVTYSKGAGKVTSVTLDDATGTVLSDGSWWLGHDDSFAILGIPEDVNYSVAEVGTYKGFTQTTPAASLEGIIVSDETVYADLVNSYSPENATSAGLKAEITKHLVGRPWQDGDSFSFFLQKYVPASGSTQASWVDVPGVSLTITKEDTADTTGELRTSSPNTAPITFTKNDIGTNYFRIGETKGSLTGITYDSTYRYYSVTVSDEDMDGKLEVSVANYQGVTVTKDTTAENTYLLETTFTNYYDQAVANINLHKDLTNDTGVDVSMDEFEFEFCQIDHDAEDDGTYAECTGHSASYLTIKPNANGDLTFPKTYVESDLNDVKDWTLVTVDGENTTTTNYKSDDAEGEITVDGDGNAILDGSNYVPVPANATKSKTFTYYLWEKAGSIPGMKYDGSVYRVDVVVTVTKGAESNDVDVTNTVVTKVKDAKGEAIAAENQTPVGSSTEKPADTAVMNFSNEYTVSPVQPAFILQGTKNLDGRAIRNDEFTFALYQANASFAKQDSNTADTVAITPVATTALAGGDVTENFLVNLPVFTQKGIHYFVLEETTGDNAAITYDASVYHITVVTDVKDGTNQLVVTSITVNKFGGASGTYNVPADAANEVIIYGTAADTGVPVVFNNKYTILQNVQIEISGDKNVVNKDIAQGEFVFGLFADEGCTTPVYVDANGVVAENGTAVTASTAAVSGIFTFNLTYNQPFSGSYYIKELNSTKDYVDGSHMQYDTTVKKVNVNVVDTNGNGILTATVTNADSSAHAATSNVFTNVFTPKPVSATVVGSKQYVTETNTPVQGAWPAFKYRMYVADKDFNVTSDVAIDTVTLGQSFTGTYTNNNGDVSFAGSATGYTDKKFELNLTFPQAGSYYYILKEVDEDNANILYDSKEYHLTFIVTDTNADGNLVVSSSMKLGGSNVTEAAFKNQQITQNVDVEIETFKNFDNNTSVVIPMSTFEFGLYTDAACTNKVTNAEGNPVVSNASTSGDASFSFKFTNDDIGTITYYVKENVPADGTQIVGMTYDYSVYQVVITVANDSNSKLYATSVVKQIVDAQGNAINNPVQATDNKAVFSNTFRMQAAKVIISGTKTLTGRDLAEGEFAFALHNAEVATDTSGAITSWTTGAQIGSNVTNTGNTFAFPEMEYTREETVYYVVKEIVGTADKMEYDKNEYLIKVVITNGNNGSFVATQDVVAKRVQTGSGYDYTFATAANTLTLNITNVFTPTPITAVIAGTKALTGDPRYDQNNVLDGIRTDEFEFELYVTDHTYNIEGKAPVKTVKNGDDAETIGVVENNVFKFEVAKSGSEYVTTDPLYFTDAGTHYFVVKEKAGTDNAITYDGKEYNILLTVTKDSNGNLAYTTQVTNAGNADKVSVTNVYDSKTATATVNIKKNLENNTNVALDITGFEFGLYEADGTTSVYTNSNGYVVPSTAAGATEVVVNPDSHGNAHITLKYTDVDYANDADHVFNYVLKETNSGKAGVTYDNKAYDVVVTLSYDANNELVASVKVDNDADKTAVFSNKYELPNAAVTISGSKAYNGWTKAATEGKTFNVFLYSTDERGNYAEPGSKKIAQATVSKVAPTFTFTSANATDDVTDAATAQLSFAAAGKYYFVVVEENDGLTKDDIIYDGKQYVVEVTVAPDNAANPTKLVATTKTTVFGHSEQIGDTDNAVTGVAFTNTDLAGTTTVDIIGKKKLNNRTLLSQEFDFELFKSESDWTLVDADATLAGTNPLFETVNRENTEHQQVDGYNVEFIGVPLEYPSTGTGSHTYYFVLKELNTGMPTITYDATEYRIAVTAAFADHDNDGSTPEVYIVQSATVKKYVDGTETTITSAYDATNKRIDLAQGNAATFTNTYNPKYTNSNTDAVIPVRKALANTTGVALNETFKFGLYQTYSGGNLSNLVTVYKAGATGEQIKDNLVLTDGTGEAVVATVTNSGDTNIVLRFSDSLYTAAADNGHKYTYYLAEIEGEKAGMSYDGTVYQVDITLSYDANKNLVATTAISEIASGVSSAATVAKAEFANEYALDSAEVVISGKKSLPQHEIYKDDFTFVMYKAVTDNGGTVETVPGSTGVWKFNENENTKVEEALNETKSDASSNDYDVFTFSKLTYDTIGEHHYIIVEKAGTLGNGTVGFDESRYQVTVNVVPDDADNVDDGETGFDELIAKVTVQKVVKKADGTFEVENSTITADDIVFNNTYTPAGTFTISGEKLIDNRDWRDSDEFTFKLYKTDSSFDVNNTAVLAGSDTVKGSDADRLFNITATITGTDSDKANIYDTHYYVLVEEASNIAAIKDAQTKYHIVVTAKDNLDGTLTAGKLDGTTFTADEFAVTKVEGSTQTPLDATDDIEFINEYLTQDAEVVISGKKEIANADIKDYKGDFTFELHMAEYDAAENKWVISDPLASPATTTNTLENGAAFEFKDIPMLKFNTTGDYYFIVREAQGTHPIITYNTANKEYVVKVTVSEKVENGNTVVNSNNEAVLEATAAVYSVSPTEIVFKNSYNPTDVTFNIKKALSFTNGASHTLGGFKFRIEGVGNNTLLEATSGNDGTIAVPFSYTEADLDVANGYAPKTYTYKITEINTGIERMTYDNRAYTIEVEVYAENGVLKTALKQNDRAVDEITVQFNNTYEGIVEVPDSPKDPGRIVNTGDIRNNMLYGGLMAASAAGLIAVLFLMKKKKDEEDEAEA